MRILQPSFKLLNTFLDSNPELTQKYVDTSVTAISHLLGPLNVFMRHLLVVKGLDPDTNPGERAAKDLQLAMSHAFSTHQKSYDEDYDFSWVQKRFEETRGHLKELQLTKEKYLDLTNLARLSDEKADDGDFTLSRTADAAVVVKNNDPEKDLALVNEVAKPATKREIKLTSEKGSYADAVKALEKFATKLEKFDPLTDLRSALDTLEKEAEKVKPAPKKKNKTTKKYTPKKIVKVGDHYALTETEKKPFDTRQQEKADLVKEMIAKGLCTPENSAQQLQEMEKWSDSSLESLKKVIGRQPSTITVGGTSDPKFRGNFRRVSPKVR